jgi:hypothetical protein
LLLGMNVSLPAGEPVVIPSLDAHDIAL